MKRSVLPRVFKVYVGGWSGPSFRVGFDGKKLNYRALVLRESECCEENASIEPSEEEWAAFWDTLDRIDVWAWKESYFDNDIFDGTQWGIKIQLGRRRLQADGSNEYPPTGTFDETPEFRDFCSAVSHLLGGKQFWQWE